jgi:hypothetical protein
VLDACAVPLMAELRAWLEGPRRRIFGECDLAKEIPSMVEGGHFDHGAGRRPRLPAQQGCARPWPSARSTAAGGSRSFHPGRHTGSGTAGIPRPLRASCAITWPRTRSIASANAHPETCSPDRLRSSSIDRRSRPRTLTSRARMPICRHGGRPSMRCTGPSSGLDPSDASTR